jgi:glycosyltransferase involved in cell wall biosynthesis
MVTSIVRRLRSLFAQSGPVTSRINLLIELSAFDKGGLEKVVLDSALRFDRNLFDVTIVSVGTPGHLAEVARAAGLRVIGLTEQDKERQYNQVLEQYSINLAVSHFSHFGYKLLRKHGIPNITFIHNVYAFLTGDALKRFKADDKYVDKYISVSAKATDYAHRRLGISLDKIITVPNGLIIEEHEERERHAEPLTRESFGLKEGDYVFLNVASYNLHKGHYVMADAMRRAIRTHPEIKILCVGNVIYPPHVEQFRQYLVDQGLADNILMPGYYSNIESFYRIVDAFMLPSFIEGWSIAMNEAMFYGKPMILTNTGGAAEVIENSDIGRLLEPEYGDFLNLDSASLDRFAYDQREFRIAQSLADAMIDFATHKEHWAQAGAKGRKKIYDHYNLDDVVRHYEHIFFDVIGWHPTGITASNPQGVHR